VSAARAEARPWWLGLVAALGAGLVWLLGHTWRIERVHAREREAELARSGCVLAVWHGRLLPLVYTHRGHGIVMLISRHRDGELITRVIERLGFRTARGSSTRGGEEGAREMLGHALEGRQVGVTPDGPRGPAREFKTGAVFLASRSGRPFVPVASAASHAWVFRSWDGFRVPWPFARVVVAYGDPISVPAELDTEATETWRRRLGGALDALTLEVVQRAGERS